MLLVGGMEVQFDRSSLIPSENTVFPLGQNSNSYLSEYLKDNHLKA